MYSLNSVQIEGKATNVCKIHVTSTNNTIATFTISHTRTYKVHDEYKKEISYFLIEAWGEEAMLAKDKIKFGVQVKIEGRLKQDRWTSDSGEHLSRIKIMADTLTIQGE